MPKTYLRYEPDDFFGIIASPAGSFYSHCGRFIFSVTYDACTIVNASTNQTLAKLHFNRDAYALTAVLHAQLNQIFVGLTDGVVVHIDLDRRETLQVYTMDGKPTSLCLSRDCTVLLVGMSNGCIQVVDLVDQVIVKSLHKEHQGSVTNIALPSSNYMLTFSTDRVCHVYDGLVRKQVIAENVVYHQQCVVTPFQIKNLFLQACDNIVSLYADRSLPECVNILQHFAGESEIHNQIVQLLNTFNDGQGDFETTNEVYISMLRDEQTVGDQEGVIFRKVSQKQFENKTKILKIVQLCDYLVVVTARNLELFQFRSNYLQQQKQRIRRTIKQRLDRINQRISKNGCSDGYKLEIQQLFGRVDYLQFTDLYESVGMFTIEQQVYTCDLFIFRQAGAKAVAKLLVQYSNSQVQYYIQEQKIEQFSQILTQHTTLPTALALNPEDTVISSADRYQQKFYTVRTCSQIDSIDLPDNFGQPSQQIILKGGVYSVISSRSGLLLITNLMRSEVESLQQISESQKPIVHIQMLDDILTAFMQDGVIKYFSFQYQDNQLKLVQERVINSQYQLTAALVTRTHIFLGLSDNTVRIYFQDTFKFKMNLYGHAMPVHQIVLSSTEEKVFTISVDKTIRAWGMTFGECLRLIKLQEQPTRLVLLGGTHNAIVSTAKGELLYYDLDTYQMVTRLGEGDFGKKFVPGHYLRVTDLVSAANGKLVVSAGADGMKTWIQGDDVMSAEIEHQKLLEKEINSGITGGAGQQWGDMLKNEQIDQLDELQQTVAECYQKITNTEQEEPQEVPQATGQDVTQQEAVKAALQAIDAEKQQPWEEQLTGTLLGRLSKSMLPELMRALPAESAEQLKQLLIKLLVEGNQQEQIVWCLLRLIRTVYPGQLGSQAQVVSQLSVKVIERLQKKARACLWLISSTEENGQ